MHLVSCLHGRLPKGILVGHVLLLFTRLEAVSLLALAHVESVHDLFLDALFDFFVELLAHLAVWRHGSTSVVLVWPAVDRAIAQHEVILRRLRHVVRLDR